MKINAVSACWSSYSYQESIARISEGTIEPLFGQLGCEHVQLCPQHANFLSLDVINELMSLYPHIQFRLHSDVRLINKRGYTIDLIDFSNDTLWYFQTLAEFSKAMNAPLYSLHAGIRGEHSLNELFDKAKALQEVFDCPVAVEGHYPFKGSHYFIDSWKEYQQLYLSDLPYALDLSHLNIVAFREGWDYDLTKEMLASSNCKEIHLSFNEGRMDSHLVSQDMHSDQWTIWKEMIESSGSKATIFSEGNQVLQLRKQAVLESKKQTF